MNIGSNLFWCIVGIVGGAVVSFITSFIFYLIGKNRKRISYKIDTTCIISNKVNQIENLDINYNSQKIDNLYSSTITIKNIGNTIIEKQDFTSDFPISFFTDGQFFIDKNGYAIPSKKIRRIYDVCKDSGTCRCVTLIFDYIPKKGLLTCSIFHTGNIIFDSKLKDGKIINMENSSSISSKILFLISFIASLISISALIISLFKK